MNVELCIQHNGVAYMPVAEEGITWSTERKGAPGTLKFNILSDNIEVEEGDLITLKVDDKKLFYGWVFVIKRDKDNILKITAYDQLRYLKNKDTYIYTNKTASEVISMICKDFYMQSGNIEDTKYKIKSRVENNQTLFDIIQSALESTLQNTKNMYIMFDDFGKVSLKSLGNMQTNILIDEETGENYDYTSSIDSNTYNKIKVVSEDKDSKQREIYIAQDSSNIQKWGVLQLYEKLNDGENGKTKADSLLNLYNTKTKSLSLKNIIGSLDVRAGSLVVVTLDLGDVKLNNNMLVEKCKHEFKNDMHLMTISLRGGEFIA